MSYGSYWALHCLNRRGIELEGSATNTSMPRITPKCGQGGRQSWRADASQISLPACAQYKCQWDVFGFLLFLYACFTLLVWISDLLFILDLVVLMASSMEISVGWAAPPDRPWGHWNLKVGFSSHHRKISFSVFLLLHPTRYVIWSWLHSTWVCRCILCR